MSIEPQDQAQRQLAINPHESIILQAPAGSGKTEILIQRYLNLLARVQAPEEIVALTFTNKAASEMQERILSELVAAYTKTKPQDTYKAHTRHLAKAVLSRDRELGWLLLENPERMQIKTFDSLCLSIIRRAPLLGKTNGIDSPSDDSREIYEATINETLSFLDENNEYSAALKTILLHLAHELTGFKELMINMLGRRDQWLRLGLSTTDEENLDSIKKNLEYSWDKLREQKVSELTSILGSELIDEFIYFDKYSNDNLAPDKKRPIAEFGKTTLDSLKSFKNWADFSLTAKSGLRKKVDKRQGFPIASKEQQAVKKDFLKLLEKLKDQQNLVNLWQDVVSLPLENFDAEKIELVEAMLKVLKLTLANLKLEFSARSEVDYIEIAETANNALGQIENPSQLALYLDNKISHILIDEFQDTNHSQFEFLKKLTQGWNANDGQTLFIVGDPMQSIYGFREADVGLFLKIIEDGINDIRLKFLKLTVNFRSSYNIVSWVNTNFASMFPAHNDHLSGAVNYVKSTAYSKNQDGEVKTFGFYSDDTKHENLKLIKLIKQTLASASPDKKFAVLVRSRQHLTYISHLLTQEQIPYRAVEMNRLTDSQAVEDLRNLSRAFLHSGDKAAWLSVLRAPWCGLNLKDLQILVDIDPDANLWDLIKAKKNQKRLSADGALRLENLTSAFKNAFKANTRYEPEIVIEKLAAELGINKYIKGLEAEAIDVFFECLRKSRINHLLSIDRLDYELQRFYLPDVTDINCQLECMTIHKAKGLEFDSVFLPMLAKTTRSQEQELIRWAERIDKQQISLLLAPIKARADKADAMYDYLGNIAKLKSRFEMMRILYVAATRAKENLYLFATLKTDSAKPPVNSHLYLLQSAFADKFESARASIESDASSTCPTLKRRKLDNLSPREINYPDFTDNEYEFLTRDEPERIAGVVFHKIAEHTARIGIDKINPNLLDEFALKKLRDELYEQSQISDMHQLIKTALVNMLEDETGRWLLSNQHKNSNQECSISTIVVGKTQQVIIDRTFITDGVFWIVDYKLTRPKPDETKNKFLNRMAKDYCEQLGFYEQLVRQITDFPIKIMLYFPLVPDSYELNPSSGI